MDANSSIQHRIFKYPRKNSQNPVKLSNTFNLLAHIPEDWSEMSPSLITDPPLPPSLPLPPSSTNLGEVNKVHDGLRYGHDPSSAFTTTNPESAIAPTLPPYRRPTPTPPSPPNRRPTPTPSPPPHRRPTPTLPPPPRRRRPSTQENNSQHIHLQNNPKKPLFSSKIGLLFLLMVLGLAFAVWTYRRG